MTTYLEDIAKTKASLDKAYPPEEDPPCLAPCYPIVCDDCPFGPLGMDVEDVVM